MADISTITKKGTTYNIKDSTARSRIESLKQADDDFTADIKKLSEEISDLQAGSGGCNCALKDGDYNVLAINHRGYCTVAPENTIPAYILSKEKGYNYVECDVSFTKDGVAVLLHNSTIDATSNGTGSISEMTYAEVLQYDFGSWKSSAYAGTKIPTFKEFITLCKNIGLHPYIELKVNGAYTEEQIASVVDIVKSVGMDGKVTYISFNFTYLEYVKNADSRARLGYLVYNFDNDWVSQVKSLRTGNNEVFFDQAYGNVTESTLALCIENNIPLEIWTVNSESVITGMNPYITGVTSDNLIAGKVLYEASMTYTPPSTEDVTLQSISATYNGGNVTVGTALTSLTGIVVTGTYSNGTTSTISGYTLSGEIIEGENIITVSYNGLTTTFTVTGVAEESGGDEPDVPVEPVEGLLYNWDFTKSMIDTVSNKEALIPNTSPVNTYQNAAYRDTNGLHIETEKDFAYIVNGWAVNRTYEVDISDVNAEYGAGIRHGRLLMCEKVDDPNTATTSETVGYNGNGLLIYRNTGAWSAWPGTWKDASSVTATDGFANKTIKLTISESGEVSIYADSELVLSYSVDASFISEWPHICLGDYGYAANDTIIKALRIYEGVV